MPLAWPFIKAGSSIDVTRVHSRVGWEHGFSLCFTELTIGDGALRATLVTFILVYQAIRWTNKWTFKPFVLSSFSTPEAQSSNGGTMVWTCSLRPHSNLDDKMNKLVPQLLILHSSTPLYRISCVNPNILCVAVCVLPHPKLGLHMSHVPDPGHRISSLRYLASLAYLCPMSLIQASAWAVSDI